MVIVHKTFKLIKYATTHLAKPKLISAELRKNLTNEGCIITPNYEMPSNHSDKPICS